MANQLKVAVVHAIEVLLERGWSQRRIAGALGVDRGTVARYAGLARAGPPGAHAITGGDSNPAKAPPGSDGASIEPGAAPGGIRGPSRGARTDSKPATEAPPGSVGPEIESAEVSGGLRSVSWGLHSARPTATTAADGVTEAPSSLRPGSQTSQCEPFREVVQAKLDKGLTARRIYQDLVSEHGFTAKYHSVRRFVRRLGKNRPLPFRRMECAPGEEAQVDFGTGAPILLPNGKRRRPHVFRIVLSHSRKGYSEAVFKQSTESFIGALENAFRHFGGVPKTLVVDNLKAAVLKADWFDPDLNPKIQSFCEHYGTVILPTKPRTPRHKGYVAYCTSSAGFETNRLSSESFTPWLLVGTTLPGGS